MKSTIISILIIFIMYQTGILYAQQYQWTKTIYDGAGQPLFTGGYRYHSLMNFVDIDGDDDKDIFFLANAGENAGYYLFYYENTGNLDSAKYEFITNKYSSYNYDYGSHSSEYPPLTTFADIDGDDDYDLIIAYGSVLRLYENSGDSLNPNFDFDNWNVVLNVTTDYCNYPAFIDIDNDNDLDIFLKHSLRLQFYRNTGNRYNYNYVLENDDLIPGYNPAGNITFFDTNNDKDYDLFFSAYHSSNGYKFCYFENIGDSTNFNFQLANDQYLDFDIWEAPKLKFISNYDIDNDSDEDFFVGFKSGPVYYYQNIGTPDSALFQLNNKNYLNIDLRGMSYPQFVDIDNDNDYDLFVAGEIEDVGGGTTEFSRIWLFENVGNENNPIFEFKSSFYDSIYDISQIYFADIDADGDYDLFTGNMDWQKSIRFYRNIGTPNSASFFLEDSAIVKIFRYEDTWPSPLLFDMDNDEDLDLLVSMRQTIWPGDHPVHIFENIGDKYMPVWGNDDTSFVMSYGVYDYWDYDHDVDYDLICGSNVYSGGQTIIFENTGNVDSAYFIYSGIFDSLYMDPWIFHLGTISLADIDADGDKDVFMGDDGGGIHFYRNDGLVGINNQNQDIPLTFSLYQNFPNPFNQTTLIKYNLIKRGKVHIAVFDVLGRIVKSLVNNFQITGIHQVQWDGTNNRGNTLSSGIYIYRAKIINNTQTVVRQKKMLLLK